MLCPCFHPGLAVASGFNFTNALILTLAFYPSYIIVLMSLLFCSCFLLPIPLLLSFSIVFNLFFCPFHCHLLPLFLAFLHFSVFSYFLLLFPELALAHAIFLALSLSLVLAIALPLTIKNLRICSKNIGSIVNIAIVSYFFVIRFVSIIGKVRYFFLIKRWYKIVIVEILNLLLLFNRRYWALNTNKWNDKKVAQPNIQKL